MSQEIYCLWLMPEKAAFAELQHIITGLSIDYKAVNFEPHLTLGVVLTTDMSDPEGALESLASQSKPLVLNNPKATIGDIFTQSVYLRFEESTELMKLHALSCEILKIKQPVFYPHLSLIYKNLDEKAKQEIASKVILPQDHTTFDRLQIVKSSASVTTSADVKTWKTICEQKI